MLFVLLRVLVVVYPPGVWCGVGVLEKLNFGAVPAGCSQLQHTHISQPPVECIRQTSQTFRENSFHLRKFYF